MILVQRATCSGCCCLSCASPSKSHCPGVDRPVSLSLIPCARCEKHRLLLKAQRQEKDAKRRDMKKKRNLELVDFLHVFFDFLFEVADARAAGEFMC